MLLKSSVHAAHSRCIGIGMATAAICGTASEPTLSDTRTQSLVLVRPPSLSL